MRLLRGHALQGRRALGETEQRIFALPVWQETGFFSARERAALGFTESVVTMADGHVPTEAFEAVAVELSPKRSPPWSA